MKAQDFRKTQEEAKKNGYYNVAVPCYIMKILDYETKETLFSHFIEDLSEEGLAKAKKEISIRYKKLKEEGNVEKQRFEF